MLYLSLAGATVAAFLTLLLRIVPVRTLLRYRSAIDVTFTVLIAVAMSGTITGMLVGILAGLIMAIVLEVMYRGMLCITIVMRNVERVSAWQERRWPTDEIQDGEWIYNKAPYV